MSTTAPLVTVFTKSLKVIPPSAQTLAVRRAHTWAMTNDTASPSLPPSSAARWRIPLLGAALVLAIVVVTAIVIGGGDDEPTPAAGSDDTSSSPTSSPTSTPVPPSDSGSPTVEPTQSAPTEGEPVSSPVINAAVRDALDDGFPALVPSGVPAGWTVFSAAYVAKDGGQWTIVLTDADGSAVLLTQTTASIRDNVRQQLGTGAEQTGTVDLEAFGTGTWKLFTAGDQVGIAKVIAKRTSVVVSGLGQDSPVAFAQQLLTAEDGAMSEAG